MSNDGSNGGSGDQFTGGGGGGGGGNGFSWPPAGYPNSAPTQTNPYGTFYKAWNGPGQQAHRVTNAQGQTIKNGTFNVTKNADGSLKLAGTGDYAAASGTIPVFKPGVQNTFSIQTPQGTFTCSGGPDGTGTITLGDSVWNLAIPPPNPNDTQGHIQFWQQVDGQNQDQGQVNGTAEDIIDLAILTCACLAIMALLLGSIAGAALIAVIAILLVLAYYFLK